MRKIRRAGAVAGSRQLWGHVGFAEPARFRVSWAPRFAAGPGHGGAAEAQRVTEASCRLLAFVYRRNRSSSEVLIPSKVTQQVALAGGGLRDSGAIAPAYDVLIPGCSLGSPGCPQFARRLGGEMVDLGRGASLGVPGALRPAPHHHHSFGRPSVPWVLQKGHFPETSDPPTAHRGAWCPPNLGPEVGCSSQDAGGLHGQGSQSPRAQAPAPGSSPSSSGCGPCLGWSSVRLGDHRT